jgi:hypothetical protein
MRSLCSFYYARHGGDLHDDKWSVGVVGIHGTFKSCRSRPPLFADDLMECKRNFFESNEHQKKFENRELQNRITKDYENNTNKPWTFEHEWHYHPSNIF